MENEGEQVVKGDCDLGRSGGVLPNLPAVRSKRKED